MLKALSELCLMALAAGIVGENHPGPLPVSSHPKMQRSSIENQLPVLLGRRPVKPVKSDVETGKTEEEGVEPYKDQAARSREKVEWQLKGCEKIALALGVLFATAQGVATPAIALFMGESITTLALADHARELDAMTPELIKAPKSPRRRGRLWITVRASASRAPALNSP